MNNIYVDKKITYAHNYLAGMTIVLMAAVFFAFIGFKLVPIPFILIFFAIFGGFFGNHVSKSHVPFITSVGIITVFFTSSAALLLILQQLSINILDFRDMILNIFFFYCIFLSWLYLHLLGSVVHDLTLKAKRKFYT